MALALSGCHVVHTTNYAGGMPSACSCVQSLDRLAASLIDDAAFQIPRLK